MRQLLTFAFMLFVQFSISQNIVCSAQDQLAFKEKTKEISNLSHSSFGKTIVAVGKTFLGTPYVAKTLEIGKKEALVINLQGLDCTTYVENVLAFSLLLRGGQTDFETFAATLEKIRYVDGRLAGYSSRLHYFSQWIADNEKKGLLKNITSEIGGKEITKKINFMSTHRELYPFLADDANYSKIKASENFLNKQAICVLARDAIAANEQKIQNGDIIALTTAIEGLDITHTGIAIRENDGRIHLLHASSSGQVEVSKLPLADYLKKIKNNTGIMVARPI